MDLRIATETRQEQRQLLLPRLLQGVEILQLPRQSLVWRLREEVTANEALLLAGPDRVEVEGEGAPRGGEDRMEWDDSVQGGRNGAGPRPDPLALAPAPAATLAAELRDQVLFRELTPPVRRAFERLLEALDARGHLPPAPQAVAQAAGEGVPREAAEQAYALLRSLEPAGVGAAGPVEAMLAQLASDDPDLPRLAEILTIHLEALARGRRKGVARALGVDRPGLERLLEKISRLEPCPGSRYDAAPAPPVRPDLLVTLGPAGELRLTLEEEDLPRPVLAPAYLRRAQSNRLPGPVRKGMEEQIRRARWLVEALEERSRTLYRVGREAVQVQAGFFRGHREHPLPLRMDRVARVLELHPSTVSRAVADKWVQHDRGIMPLKELFPAGSAPAGDLSRQALGDLIAAMIREESPDRPLSDGEIARRLAARGLALARRTVAKYRAERTLPPCRERRRD